MLWDESSSLNASGPVSANMTVKVWVSGGRAGGW